VHVCMYLFMCMVGLLSWSWCYNIGNLLLFSATTTVSIWIVGAHSCERLGKEVGMFDSNLKIFYVIEFASLNTYWAG